MSVESLGEVVTFGAGAYGVRYGNYVAVFFTTSDGVIVVDPCGQVTPRLPGLIREAIGIVTDQTGQVRGLQPLGFGSCPRRCRLWTGAVRRSSQCGPKIRAENDPNSPEPALSSASTQRLRWATHASTCIQPSSLTVTTTSSCTSLAVRS